MRRTAAALVALGGLGALAGCTATGGTTGASTTVTVFAAASLTDVVARLAAEFEEQHPSIEIEPSFGGSSALVEQVVAGAPADVVATADLDSMARLGGLALDPHVFATNSLVLVVPAGNPAGITGLADLARDEPVVALCDESVPCGAAAARVLAAAGVDASADTLEQDVRAVLAKVVLGEADAGIVYRTDALAAGDAIESIDLGAGIATSCAITVVDGADEAAADFVAFVRSDRGREVLADAGFGLP